MLMPLVMVALVQRLERRPKNRSMVGGWWGLGGLLRGLRCCSGSYIYLKAARLQPSQGTPLPGHPSLVAMVTPMTECGRTRLHYIRYS